jgi:hypothetical protein
VTVEAAKWHGESVLTLTYRRASGEVGRELIYRADGARLDVAGRGVGRLALFRLASTHLLR